MKWRGGLLISPFSLSTGIKTTAEDKWLLMINGWRAKQIHLSSLCSLVLLPHPCTSVLSYPHWLFSECINQGSDKHHEKYTVLHLLCYCCEGSNCISIHLLGLILDLFTFDSVILESLHGFTFSLLGTDLTLMAVFYSVSSEDADQSVCNPLTSRSSHAKNDLIYNHAS